MKIVLIYLPHPYLVQPDAQAPLGLMYLASVIRDAGYEIEICNFSNLTIDTAMDALPTADIYGITITSLDLPQANRFAVKIKSKFPKSAVFLGGPGTCTPEMVNWDVVDSICWSEGESVIVDMIEAHRCDRLIRVYRGIPIEDVNTIPFPARDLLKGGLGGNIFAYNKVFNVGGSTIIISSRGCPNRCAFCSAPFLANGRIRHRSPASICAEIQQVRDTYGISQFRFSDNTFTTSKRRTLEVCKAIGELGVIWRISTRSKPFDREMAQALFDSGCREISFGVESFDDDVLRFLNKGITVAENIEALECTAAVGLTTRILLMIRTPGQTKKTVQRNIEGLKRVPYDIVACTMFVPLPGSDIWNNPEGYNIEILDRNLDHYNFYFYDDEGQTELQSIIKIKHRSLEEFNRESDEFRKYVMTAGKSNRG